MSRNVLAPPLLHMSNNRCYRVNEVHEDFSDQRQAAMKAHPQSTRQAYDEQDLYGEEYNDEIDDELSDIECQNSVFKLKIHVASAFYGGLVGTRGSTKHRLESETSTEILIPPRVVENSNKNRDCSIIIKGKTRNAVATAKRKIDLLVASLRSRMAATHFYGIALNHDEIRENFQLFKELILSAQIAGIDESLFQLDTSIHATFGACVLMDDVERSKAAAVLQSCREFLVDVKTPFKVRVKGLEIMNDDPSAVRVLYAILESPDLQTFADRCFLRFKESGFQRDHERGNVKFHMTLMNNRYKEEYSEGNSKKGISKNFDAREILKRWADFDFGSAECKEILLCVIGSSREMKGEFYKITSSLKF